MCYHNLRLSKSAMECVISALNMKYAMAVLKDDIKEAETYSNLESYFQSKLSDSYSVYE